MSSLFPDRQPPFTPDDDRQAQQAQERKKRETLTLSAKTPEVAFMLLQSENVSLFDNESLSKLLKQAWIYMYPGLSDTNYNYIAGLVDNVWTKLLTEKCSGYIDKDTNQVDLVGIVNLFQGVIAGPLEPGKRNIRVILHRCIRKKLLWETYDQLDLAHFISEEEVALLPPTYR
jgi:hypothetical protein